MASFLIAQRQGFGEWVPAAYVATPKTYREAWLELRRQGGNEGRMLGFVKVNRPGGTWQENDDPERPMTPVDAWVMLPNHAHYKLMTGKHLTKEDLA